MKKLLISISIGLMLLLNSFAFGQTVSEKKSYDCIKEKYGDKGSVIDFDTRKSYIIRNKNNDRLYFLDDMSFFHVKEGQGWRTEGKYSSSESTYEIKDKKGNLYDYVDNFLGIKKKEAIISDNCMKIGSRLKLVSNKISKDFKSEYIDNFGCVIRCKNTNKYGVNYNLSFSEEPNSYQISFNSDDPIKLKSGSFLEKLTEGDNETQKQLRELLNQELKNVVINGKYKINEFQQLSLYYITFNKINGKKENIYYNKEQRIYIIDEIINSFEYD